MKLLANILWLLFGGFLIALEYLVSSLCLMITLVGIPFGIQALKLGMLALWPFGSRVVDNGSGSGCLSIAMNILWILLGGLPICLTHLFLGILLCITLLGIPFGKQHFKMAGLALTPFGKQILRN
ncbi:MAG: YccF domain-containing protein [Tannerella sp.]|jgi:uncharacterized membrane protein YccF (DUF307 family)|nr:YccF domain-containing protein [Tannerella sp.]